MDRDHPNALYLTVYAIYRSSIAAVDANSDAVVDTLDLSKTVNAINGRIHVIPRCTSASPSGKTVTVDLYHSIPGSSLAGIWRKLDTRTVEHLAETQFTDLYAGTYKLVVTTITAASTWELHTSRSQSIVS